MLDKDLDWLISRESISDLPVRYCDCVWRDDMEGLVALFAPAGSFVAIFDGIETVVSGREALMEFYEAAVRFTPRPYIHNHVVEIVSKKFATGRCYLDLRSGRHNMDWLGAGFYEDEYVKIDSEWRFQLRKFTALRMEELPEGINLSR